MPSPIAWTRIHQTFTDLEHPAIGDSLSKVLMSMQNASQDGINPFKVRVRMDDGTSVVVKPRGWKDA